jgi:hypothetical protein
MGVGMGSDATQRHWCHPWLWTMASGCLVSVVFWPSSPLGRLLAFLAGAAAGGLLAFVPAFARLAFDRRWWRFRLRTLLFVVFLVALGLKACDTAHRRLYREPRQFIAAVEKLGGQVHKKQLGPQWLGAFEADSVHFDRTPLQDAQLIHLTSLPGARSVISLYVADTLITDACMAHLKDFPLLKGIGFIRCSISDRNLDHFCALKQLRYISLIGTEVTPDGVKRLENWGYQVQWYGRDRRSAEKVHSAART